MSSFVPPRYVNVSSAIVYGDDLPDPLFRTYTRLVGLAWRDEQHAHLPVLPLEDLAAICHHKPRAMRLHLKQLAKRQLIAYNGDRSAFRIRILDPKMQKVAPPEGLSSPLLASQDHKSDLDQPTKPAAQGPSQKELTLRANLAALAEFQVNVDVPEARKAAALQHVTPDLIRAWGHELAQHPHIRNLPGLLLYTLSTTRQGPRRETRGGARSLKRRARPDLHLDDEAAACLSSPYPPQASEVDARPSIDEKVKDPRLTLLLQLAQAERQPLDLHLAWQLVQPYTVEDVAALVTYVRIAEGQSEPRLEYALERLQTGELPVFDALDPGPEGKQSVIQAPCPSCKGVFSQATLCRGCGQCKNCCICEPEGVDAARKEAQRIWQITLGELQLQMTRETFNRWLRQTRALDCGGGLLRVEVDNDYVKDWLSNRLLQTIRRTVNSITDEKLEVEFLTNGEETSPTQTPQ